MDNNNQTENKCHSSGSYHHGNLKNALVDCYIELLAQYPPEKLSLRKLASQLGVAPTAVYNHFADKNALTTAVRIRCLDHFACYLDGHTPQGRSPEDNIVSLGKAYFHYSIEHSEYFQIMFQHTDSEPTVTEELVAAGMRAEAKLRSSVIDLLDHHNIPASRYNEGLGAFACWALAHGITTLAATHVNRAACATDRWPPEFMLDSEESVNQAFDALSQVLIAGILSAAKK